MKLLDHERDQVDIPIEADVQAREILALADQKGGLIASKGTDRFALFSRLEELELLVAYHCEEALGVTQFNITNKGMELIA